MINEQVALNVQHLRKVFPIKGGFVGAILGKRQFVHAVDDVSFQIKKGKVLGMAGESGCGKTTTGRLLAMLLRPTAGHILFKGVDITDPKFGKTQRKKIQMIFQDPFDTLNPRFNVINTLLEPLNLHKIGVSRTEREEMVCKMLERVNVDPSGHLHKYPNELSGGEKQRVAISRAMILHPEFVVADEPTSMLDATVKSGILDLMIKLKEEFDITYLFITHDLAIARHICDEIAIMYTGKIVELGQMEEVISEPLHPYTRALLSAVPVPDPTIKRERLRIRGEPSNPINPPPGCRFHTRCPYAKDVCSKVEPRLKGVSKTHFVACYSDSG